jgi:hypothetical protein
MHAPRAHRHRHLNIMREGDQRDLVAGPQGVIQPLTRLDEPPQPFAAHAVADVEGQHDSQRQIADGHGPHVLPHAVIGQDEIFGGQSEDWTAPAHHRHVHFDRLDGRSKGGPLCESRRRQDQREDDTRRLRPNHRRLACLCNESSTGVSVTPSRSVSQGSGRSGSG